MSQKPETVFDIDQLFAELNRSFVGAALDLKRTFEGDEWKDSPFVYHMPKMHLSMKLELSHSNGRVKGVFTKTTETRESQVLSTIDIDVVAVPRGQAKP
jgi:hypothetical protein